MTDSRPRRYQLFLLLFAVSGFSGLLYESIWGQYLKLLLGHAAYAQALVLAIFMGGMAIGAWIPSRFGTRWRNLLVTYAVVEGIIGVCAVVFHALFVHVTDFSYDVVLPALGAPWAVDLFRWTLAALLILPQSILLGSTFPLMCGALLRRYPDQPGATLAMLYFTNSFGAAVGVLISGFVLIERVGLPGTILTAGLINIVLAMVVWLLARADPEPQPARASPSTEGTHRSDSWRRFLVVAFLTGAASFMYEIGWIRMLSLVLGTSTHAFELMLSAFIFGLAFGGLWIRRRIDRLASTTRFLAWVQIAMGLLALGTLVAYNSSFEVMRVLMDGLARSASGYQLYNLASHGIALVVMVPVTFCAGMTLPLITYSLLRAGHGEKSIGAVYAANTLGAITGVFVAVHIGLPMLGLKGLITAGAAVDMVLGVALLATAAAAVNRYAVWAAASLAAISLTLVLGGVQLDRYKMASGVYRLGELYRPDSAELLFHRDGKTATVSLIRVADGSVSIRTNGKSDAAISLRDGVPPKADESTMTLAGAIPLILHPHARTVANIGMGSGLTTHVLLANAGVERVDTIEIEPAMVMAARGFGQRVEAAFGDPRSHIHIDDAKAFFAARQSRYDIIISEPSNPWVSGVATLFSDEFYRRTLTHLNAGGLFVQWLQLYEIDLHLVASVMKAIGRNFPDYVLFAPNDSDLLIVASRDGAVPSLPSAARWGGRLASELERVGIRSAHDLSLRQIGDRTSLGPLFEHEPVAVNSDFFPILDQNAVRARFMGSRADAILSLDATGLPIAELLGARRPAIHTRPSPTASSAYLGSRRARDAALAKSADRREALDMTEFSQMSLPRNLFLVQRLAKNCHGASAPALWLESVSEIMEAVTPYVSPAEGRQLVQRLRTSDCYVRLPSTHQEIISLLGAIAARDATGMARFAERLLANPAVPREQVKFLLQAGMLGNLAADQPRAALALWQRFASPVIARQPDIPTRLLWAHSVHRSLKPRPDP